MKVSNNNLIEYFAVLGLDFKKFELTKIHSKIEKIPKYVNLNYYLNEI